MVSTSRSARLFLALVVLAPTPAAAQIAKLELHEIGSRSPGDEEFLTGKKDVKPATVLGELRIPRPGTDRLPAVIVLHGSGGLTDREDIWGREFNALGIATLMIDSFTPRGIATTISNQDQLTRMAQVLDAYRGLELLAKHPRIDATRVAVIGFSRGGGAAHWTALKRFHAMHGPADGLAFAGHIAFYPTCNRNFLDAEATTGKPIRIFHGTADDYIPVGSCRIYVQRLKKAGNDITLTEYVGAHHGFDNPARKAPVKAAQAQTTRNCPVIEEAPGGRLLNSQTKVPFTYASDPCVERGTTLAFDASAYEQALAAVRNFVRETLKPK
jgi:dienelactone hydrolase